MSAMDVPSPTFCVDVVASGGTKSRDRRDKSGATAEIERFR
jgi:hypothetical protein